MSPTLHLDYSVIPQGTGDPRGLTFPLWFSIREAEVGVFREGRQDSSVLATPCTRCAFHLDV